MLIAAFIILLLSVLPATAQQFLADNISPILSYSLDDLPPAIYHYTRVLGGLDGKLLSPTLVQGSDGALSRPCGERSYALNADMAITMCQGSSGSTTKVSITSTSVRHA